MSRTFSTIITNPPFQDREARGHTRHKLWLDFTRLCMDSLLEEDGHFCQVSPASFRSPSSLVLDYFRTYQVQWVDLTVNRFFPDVALDFATYHLTRTPDDGQQPTTIYTAQGEFPVRFNPQLFYVPNELTEASTSIHRKVIFETTDKLPVERDYVTCHNIILKRDGQAGTLSKTRTERHIYPVFHTNRQTWYSAVRQPFASAPKVMWTRSGYTRPFFDAGELGVTDMAYFVKVPDDTSGRHLEHNMNSALLRYIYKTARWSGFGHERVFDALPVLPLDRSLADEEMFDLFELSPAERQEVMHHVG